jgi:hypothetical protein
LQELDTSKLDTLSVNEKPVQAGHGVRAREETTKQNRIAAVTAESLKITHGILL